MKLDFILNGQEVTCFIPHDVSWKTYHVTKHPIINFENEGFYLFINKTEKYIRSLREKQINALNCKIDINKGKQLFCKMCKFSDKCVVEIDQIIKLYIRLIKTVLKNDHNKSRNAEYLDNINNKLCLIILNNHGMTAIMSIRKDKYQLLTLYGYQQNNTNEMGLSFKSLLGDKLWRTNSNILYWKKRFRNKKRFSNVKKEIPSNWEVSW